MLDDWFQTKSIPASYLDFAHLPRHPAYRYEYFSEAIQLSGRPRYYHALLPINRTSPLPEPLVLGEAVHFRPLVPEDWKQFPRVFDSAFAPHAPFAQLNERDRASCVNECLYRTRAELDGPLVQAASMVAVTGPQAAVCGAILITLMHSGNLETFDDPRWMEQPPERAVEMRWGRPHITWIFVDRSQSRWGIGTELLQHSLKVLHEMGYTELASTVMLGNESSMLWHWRNGFRLLGYLGSRRNHRTPN